MIEKLETELQEAFIDLQRSSKEKTRTTRHEVRYALAYRRLFLAGQRQFPRSKNMNYAAGHNKG